MNWVKMRSICLAILLGALLIIPAPQAWAQEANELPEGWEIQLIPMWMWVAGFDEHVGDIVERTFDDFPSGDPKVADSNNKPINLEMDSNVTGRVELTYLMNQYGFGVSGWFFLTDSDDESGGVTSPGDDGSNVFVNSVTMWDAPFLPFIDEGTEFGPFSFFADSELNTFTVDLYGLRTLAEKPASRIYLLAGVKVGWLDMELNHGLSTSGSTEEDDRSFSASSAAEAEYWGIGPMVGFAGDVKREQFRVKAFITQSVLAGEQDLDGVFNSNFDDEGFPVRGSVRFNKEETLFVPVTEMQIKAKYEITENIAIGLAGFASIWYDAPAPPTYHAPLGSGDFELAATEGGPSEDGILAGTWELEERTLVYLGAGIDIEIMWP